MDKVEIAKTVSGLAISIGVESIISNAVKATTPEDTKTLNKVCTFVGVIVISGIVGKIAVEYAEDKIDCVSKWMKKSIKEAKEKQEKETI